MADIFERDHLPKDKAVQSKLIRWIPLHHHAWSSTFLFYWHPFQTLHCQNPTETSHSSQEDSGTLYFNHRTTSNNDVNSIMCWVCGKKKKEQNMNRNIMQGFSVVVMNISPYLTQKKSGGKSSAHVIHLVITPLLYLQKKDILYMGFHIDIGLGDLSGFWLGFRPSSW